MHLMLHGAVLSHLYARDRVGFSDLSCEEWAPFLTVCLPFPKLDTTCPLHCLRHDFMRTLWFLIPHKLFRTERVLLLCPSVRTINVHAVLVDGRALWELGRTICVQNLNRVRQKMALVHTRLIHNEHQTARIPPS